jgi:uncharacterized membrane protein
LGLQQTTAGALSYAFWWISGLIVFFTEKKNRLVRFHAMQSILLFGSVSIVNVILGQLGPLSFLAGLIWLAALIGWIILLVNAFQGRYFKLPVVGEYAEKFSNQ